MNPHRHDSSRAGGGLSSGHEEARRAAMIAVQRNAGSCGSAVGRRHERWRALEPATVHSAEAEQARHHMRYVQQKCGARLDGQADDELPDPTAVRKRALDERVHARHLLEESDWQGGPYRESVLTVARAPCDFMDPPVRKPATRATSEEVVQRGVTVSDGVEREKLSPRQSRHCARVRRAPDNRPPAEGG